MWTMGSRGGGWKGREGWERICLEGLEQRERSPRLVPSSRCSLKGLAGRSCSTLGLEVVNFGVSLGLPGTGAAVLPLRDSVEDRKWVCLGLSEPSWPSPALRLGLGLGGASSMAFWGSLGLSWTFWPAPPLP